MIEVSGVTKRYGSTAVVDNVSLKIKGARITSLIGPNGAGKSTLLGLISRLIRPDEGHILVDGMDVHSTPSATLAKRLAILKQENHFDARITVEDLVAFGRFPHSRGNLNASDHEHIRRSLQYFELEPFRKRFVNELSGGQRQRAFVAMVMCQDTEYVLLDEPLNNLDMRHSVQMMQQLQRLVNDFGKTIVVVMHDINFASWYSGHIVAMRDARVLFDGHPSEIMTPAALEALYDISVDVHSVNGKKIGVYFGAGQDRDV